jgi:hypothetical protein
MPYSRYIIDEGTPYRFMDGFPFGKYINGVYWELKRNGEKGIDTASAWGKAELRRLESMPCPKTGNATLMEEAKDGSKDDCLWIK